jgi:hypothetical protein
MQYQPTVRVVGSPLIDTLMLAVPPQPILTAPDRALLISAGLRVTTRLRVVNTSGVAAQILGAAWLDTMSGVARLRDVLLDPAAREALPNVHLWPGFYPPPNLLPGDSTSLTFTNDIGNPQDTVMTLHYLILYKNRLGGLYDTYYWARLKSGNVPVSSAVRFVRVGKDTVPVIRLAMSRSDARRMFTWVDSHEECFAYSKEEGRGLMEWFERAARKAEARPSP